jgi:hypothetical protein
MQLLIKGRVSLMESEVLFLLSLITTIQSKLGEMI